jgi:hypothetical protein
MIESKAAPSFYFCILSQTKAGLNAAWEVACSRPLSSP